MGVVSLFAVLVLSHVRHEGNRLSLLFYASIGFCVAYAFLFFSHINVYAYITYSLFTVFLQPIYRVSEHVIDLRSVEIIQGDSSSFYPGLLYRDLIIWIGRMFALFLLACATFFLEDISAALQFGVVLLAVYMLLTWWSAKRLLNN